MGISLFNIDIFNSDDDLSKNTGFSILEIGTKEWARCLLGLTYIENTNIYLSIFWFNFFIKL
jgi:hypothetical protein